MNSVYEKFKRDTIVEMMIDDIDKRIWDKLHKKIMQFYKNINHKECKSAYVDLSDMDFQGNKATSIHFLLFHKLQEVNEYNYTKLNP